MYDPTQPDASNVSVAIASAGEMASEAVADVRIAVAIDAGSETSSDLLVSSAVPGVYPGAGGGGWPVWNGPQERVWTTRITCRIDSASEASSDAIVNVGPRPWTPEEIAADDEEILMLYAGYEFLL